MTQHSGDEDRFPPARSEWQRNTPPTRNEEPEPDEDFEDGEERPSGSPRRNRGLTVLLVIAVSVAALLYLGRGPSGTGEKWDYGKFRRKLDADEIHRVTIIGQERIEGEYVTEKQERRQFWCEIGPTVKVDEELAKALDRHTEGRWNIEQPDTTLRTFLVTLLPWVLIMVFLWFVFFRQLRGGGPGAGVLNFGKARAKLFAEERPKITFDDVAGIDEAKEEVAEVVEFLKNPKKFERLGARIPRGVLLVGAPGTGKTLLAKAIAGEARVPFFSISGSDFVEMFVGVGASRVRDLFRNARDKAPAIIFLDEIDAVGRRRGTGLGGGHDEREQTLNSILVEMDGFDTDTTVIVMAATNRPDVLDPALLRAGRFDRSVDVPMPDIKGREAILAVHMKKVKSAGPVDAARIARGTPGFAGADIEALVNEAALRAVRRGAAGVMTADLEAARDKIMWGKERKSLQQSREELTATAWHEAGHALVQISVPHADPLHKVTIVPRGRALGATMSLPERDVFNLTREQLQSRLQVAYGGRIAEELGVGTISTGAANDIEHATELAKRMVTVFGMDETIGPIRYSNAEEHVFLGYDIARDKDHSEATSEAIDRAVKGLVTAAYGAARTLLESRRAELGRLAEALLVHETLDREEVEAAITGGDVAALRATREAQAASAARAETESAPKPRPAPAGEDVIDGRPSPVPS